MNDLVHDNSYLVLYSIPIAKHLLHIIICLTEVY